MSTNAPALTVELIGTCPTRAPVDSSTMKTETRFDDRVPVFLT